MMLIDNKRGSSGNCVDVKNSSPFEGRGEERVINE